MQPASRFISFLAFSVLRASFTGVSVRMDDFTFILTVLVFFLGPAFGYSLTCSGVLGLGVVPLVDGRLNWFGASPMSMPPLVDG